MFDNYIVPVFFGGGALALLGLVLFGWALPSFLKGKWSYLISLLGLGLVVFAYFDGVGIGFCYQCLLTDELDDGIIQKIKIKNMEVAHPISLVWLKGNDQLKEEIQVVKEILK